MNATVKGIVTNIQSGDAVTIIEGVWKLGAETEASAQLAGRGFILTSYVNRAALITAMSTALGISAGTVTTNIASIPDLYITYGTSGQTALTAYWDASVPGSAGAGYSITSTNGGANLVYGNQYTPSVRIYESRNSGADAGPYAGAWTASSLFPIAPTSPTTTPTNGATGVSQNVTIDATFNTPMDFSTAAANFKVYTDSGRTIELPGTIGQISSTVWRWTQSPVTNPITAPTVIASGTGGTLATGTYYVKYAWRTLDGWTLPSPTSTVTITLGQNISTTVPSLPTGAIEATIYIGTTDVGATLQVASPATTIIYGKALASGRAVPVSTNSALVVPYYRSTLYPCVKVGAKSSPGLSIPSQLNWTFQVIGTGGGSRRPVIAWFYDDILQGDYRGVKLGTMDSGGSWTGCISVRRWSSAAFYSVSDTNDVEQITTAPRSIGWHKIEWNMVNKTVAIDEAVIYTWTTAPYFAFLVDISGYNPCTSFYDHIVCDRFIEDFETTIDTSRWIQSGGPSTIVSSTVNHLTGTSSLAFTITTAADTDVGFTMGAI